MKKFIVLPFEEYNRLKKNENKNTSKTSEIENNLENILSTKNENEDQKRLFYTQLLDKLILQKNEEKVKEIKSKENSLINIKEKIISLLPSQLLKKGLTLLNIFQSNKDIMLNDNGEVTIFGKKISGSNIIDLINFTFKNVTPSPVGAEEYKSWILHSSGIPNSFITNSTIKKESSAQNTYSKGKKRIRKESPSPDRIDKKKVLRSRSVNAKSFEKLKWQKY